MWNTYDLPEPMGAMWIVISPAPGLFCLSTMVQADLGKMTFGSERHDKHDSSG